MQIRNKTKSALLACIIGTSVLGITSPVLADDAGAFIGGMLAGKILHNMTERTQAEQQQAYYASQQSRAAPVQQAAPAKRSAEDRIKELDKLAAGGYITPAEYKAKKKQILDSM
jgi:hypothetical protein